MIFVFSSNLAGRHGKGAALCAKNHHGAEYGIGVGRTGNAYAIPTKDRRIRTLPLPRIAKYVAEFLAYARAHPELEFEVTKIGCGLAGFIPLKDPCRMYSMVMNGSYRTERHRKNNMSPLFISYLNKFKLFLLRFDTTPNNCISKISHFTSKIAIVNQFHRLYKKELLLFYSICYFTVIEDIEGQKYKITAYKIFLY